MQKLNTQIQFFIIPNYVIRFLLKIKINIEENIKFI